ncbi:chaperone protein [Pseudozyma hubeiensis SY62]|uniref:Chaperone protein n=1 Tax=Pseudozyma hubeiensis (strain SY62) TaxID=1305764 RepID=R9P9L3_PSEHS|nr:chaperone protein [Pseudozyma hubeiensis SY62]GAC98061.1 chaperone protein [Pseudozyma hubeiensis SY62]
MSLAGRNASSSCTSSSPSHQSSKVAHPPTSPTSNLESVARPPNSTQHARSTASADLDDTADSVTCRRGFDGERPSSFISIASSSFPSAPSSSSLNRTLADYEGYTAFFDGLRSRGSLDSESQVARVDSGFERLSLNLSNITLGDFDDEEDLKDLSALQFSRSMRMNLEALTRSSADQYAYNGDGYSDPNEHLDAKHTQEAYEATSIQESYAQLISRLAFAGVVYPDGERYSLEHRQTATPRTSSIKNSPLTASLASGRSSSDVNDDEIRTPPESDFERFGSPPNAEASMEAVRPPAHSSEQVAPPAQASSQTPPSSLPQTVSEKATLRSPFKQAPHVQERPHSQAPSNRCDVGDNSELELLSDDVSAQRRAAGKARAMPWHTDTAPSSVTGHLNDRRRSSAYPVVELESNKPFTRLEPQDIAFSASTLPERALSAADCVEIIVASHPAICNAPLRQFGEDGQPLPPTKKHETSEDEWRARKEALQVKFCAKQRLSLIKAMVVMESRSASWKRIGPLNASKGSTQASPEQVHHESSPRSSNEVGRLPAMPSPWSMEMQHEQLDVAQIKGKSKRTIELASLRINARCVKCDGSGFGACITCKAEQADECFWCCGTGREKTRAQAWCRRCQGAGVLKCNTCSGSLKSACRSCQGTGTGEYGFFVDVTVKRVEMPAVPLSTLFPQMESAASSFEPSYDEVKTAATLALWDSITKLTEARAQLVTAKGGKGKSKEMVPVMAACMWENSISQVVGVDVPLAARFKKGATPSLRPEGLHRKIPTQRRFFTVPNDEDLRSVEVSEEEARKLGAPTSSQIRSCQSRGSPSTTPHSPSPLASYESSPAASSVDLHGRPVLATPKSGGGVSGYSTPSRVPSPQSEVTPAKPAAKEFVHRPSPLSQLAAATPAGTPPVTVQHDQMDRSYFDDPFCASSQGQDADQRLQSAFEPKPRRPSAGQILSKKLSSNILNKFGAHRGSL